TRERIGKSRAVFFVDVVAEVRTTQLIGREPEHAAHRLAAENIASAGGELPNPVLRGVDDVAQALLALADADLSKAPTPALRHLTQGSAHCGREPSRIALEHVVHRSTAQRFDRALLADGPREKDERHVRRGLGGDVERREPVERGNREIGEDEMRTEVAERASEGRLRVDAMAHAADAIALELAHGQLRLGRNVLDDQYAQVQWH